MSGNKLTKDLEIMFEQYVNDFEASCVLSQKAKIFRPDTTDMQRAGDVVYRPQHYHAALVSGLDLSAAAKTAALQRMVPSIMRSPQNVIYELDAREMRDDEHKTDLGRAAGQRIAAQIDVDLTNEVALRATNVITTSAAGAAQGVSGRDLWNAAAGLKAQLTKIGVPAGLSRSAFWTADSAKDLAAELGHRQTYTDAVKTAYQAAQIPNVAGFNSFEVDVNSYLGAGSAAAITLGAAPAHKIEVQDNHNDTDANYYNLANMLSIAPPPDNRQGDITVSAASGLKVGDAFTIDGVNMVHRITLTDTGSPQVFRVLAFSGTTATITPKILPVNNADVNSRPYANVTANPASGAALTVLNKNAAAPSVVWADGSVELMLGKLAFPTGEGAQIMTATTKQGAYLVMGYQFDLKTGKTYCRFTTMYGCNVLIPEYAGLVLPGQ